MMMGLAEALAEAAELNIGVTRHWKSGDFKKVRKGQWKRLKTSRKTLQGVVMTAGAEGAKVLPPKDAAAAVKRAREETEKLPGTISALKDLIAKGATAKGLTIEDHIKIAETEIREQEAAMGPLLMDLHELAPHGKVSGRIKTLESTLGKVVRRHHHEHKNVDGHEITGSFDMNRPRIDRPDKLADISGARVVHHTIEEVNETVKKVLEFFGDRILKYEDRIVKPLDTGYRSVHFDVRDHDGKVKEIQVRTKNQQVWADWNHDYYKPTKEHQVEWKKATDKQIDDVFNEYGRKMSDYFLAMDNGKKLTKPDCPPLVRDSPFGCLEAENR